MCWMYYLGADRPLPLIEDNNEFPGICVLDDLGNVATDVRDVLTAPFVYYVGSYAGCGCGFASSTRAWLDWRLSEVSDEEERQDVIEDWEIGDESKASLFRYLTAQIRDGPLTLYVGYATCIGAPIKHARTVPVDFFNNATFEGAGEDSLFTILPNAVFSGGEHVEQ